MMEGGIGTSIGRGSWSRGPLSRAQSRRVPKKEVASPIKFQLATSFFGEMIGCSIDGFVLGVGGYVLKIASII
jgi:hypothetical protein